MVPMLVDHQSRFLEKSQVLGSASFQSMFITLAHLQLRLLGVDCILSAHYFTGAVMFSFFQAWVGHPYYDVIDNSTDFNQKCMRMMAVSINVYHGV